jgi:hypothetical protein
VLAGVGAAVAGGVWAISGSAPLAEGPLACPDCGSNVLAMPVEVGRPLTYSLMVLRDHGRRTAVLDRVDLFRLSSGFRVLRLAVRRPIQPVYASLRRFPPPPGDDLEPLRGFRVLPGAGPWREGQLVIGMRIDRPGVSSFNGIAVSYHVGKHRFRAILKAGFVVCGPRHAYPAGCPRSAQKLLPP